MSAPAAAPNPAIREKLVAALDHLRRGNLDAGDSLLQQVLRFSPREPSALHLAGTVALQRGDRAEAIRMIGDAVAIMPSLAAAHCDLGYALTADGQFEKAETHLKRALELRPVFPEAWLNLGNAQRETARLAAAEASYRRAIGLRPVFPEARGNLATVLIDLGRPVEAEASARKAIEQRPGFVEAHQVLGRVLDSLGRLDEAIAAHQQAIALNPRNARSHAALAASLMAFGRRDEAIASYQAALQLDPANGEWRRMLGKLDGEDNSLEHASAQHQAAAPDSEERMHLAFRLGKTLEDAGDYSGAMPYLLEANRIKRASYQYARASSDVAFADIEGGFPAELFAAHPLAGDPDPTPIFVLGMPRSGTTLVEQILASHPDVFGAGELPLLRNIVAGTLAEDEPLDYATLLPRLGDAGFSKLGADYVRQLRGYSSAARFITDKMPGNFLLIGMIRLMLPNAKIIHCVRDPADTAISIFKNYFAGGTGLLGYAYDLGEIGHYHRLYQHLMAHWHRVLPDFVYDISYEALVADQEGETRRLLAQCGLDFRPECLSFFETVRPVHTASMAQVRSPISASSVGIAKHYGEALAPLHRALRGD